MHFELNALGLGTLQAGAASLAGATLGVERGHQTLGWFRREREVHEAFAQGRDVDLTFAWKAVRF